MIDKGRLKVARALATFVDDEVLPGTGIDPGDSWAGASGGRLTAPDGGKSGQTERQ